MLRYLFKPLKGRPLRGLALGTRQPGLIIVAGALSQPLSDSPSDLLTFEFEALPNAGDSPLVITVDGDLTQINDGLLFLSKASDNTINLRTGETRILDWSIR